MIARNLARVELKYFITKEEMRMARSLIAPFTRLDPHAQGRENRHYTVRSIYFDTPNLRFYHEKEAGKNVRKKLRLRTYNTYSKRSMGFAEIKRKYGNAIVKERVCMPFDLAASLLGDGPSNGNPPVDIKDLDLTQAAHESLERFLLLREILWLSPKVLVVYDREPHVGRANPRVRITFDRYMRSMIRPTIGEMFSEKDLRCLANGKRILEIKFNGPMPQWLRPLTARLNRSHRPISKYCKGIDLWSRPAP
jgi:hypothetical protein